MPKNIAYLLLLLAWSIWPPGSAAAQVAFQPRLLTLDANEGIAAGDIDGDGAIDLVAGRNWFRAPEFVPRPLRTISDWNGYVQSNGDFLFDVNGDGRLDVIAGSFLPTEVHWYENPGAAALELGQQWKPHLLVDTGDSSNEGQMLQDLDGDGIPEWIVNSWAKDVPAKVWRLVPANPADGNHTGGGARYTMVAHELGPRGNGHGLGVGDLNGDGLTDVLFGQGWYQQPRQSPWSTPWKFHADWDIHVSLPIIVTDLNGDQRNDLILGNGHDYGLFWWENKGPDEDGLIDWTRHLIDDRYSQPHTLAWSDIDGDGQPELITGKRVRAHNGNDPGGNEPPCLYYYDWDADNATFTRHIIEEGHAGCGLQIVTADLTRDGKVDIAVAGKSGTFLLIAE